MNIYEYLVNFIAVKNIDSLVITFKTALFNSHTFLNTLFFRRNCMCMMHLNKKNRMKEQCFKERWGTSGAVLKEPFISQMPWFLSTHTSPSHPWRPLPGGFQRKLSVQRKMCLCKEKMGTEEAIILHLFFPLLNNQWNRIAIAKNLYSTLPSEWAVLQQRIKW